MESHYAQCTQADRDLQRAIHDQDLRLTILHRFDRIENLLNRAKDVGIEFKSWLNLFTLKLRQEFKLCKLDIGRLGNSTETATPSDSSACASSSFQAAQSHLVPSDEGAAALPPPPRLPFQQLPWVRSEGARSQPRRLRQKPDWTKLPRIMRCKYSVSRIQKILAACASGGRTDKLVTARLFFAVASPFAMAQLQELLTAMRRNENSLPFPEVGSINGVMDALDRSDGSGLIACIRSRLHLVDLVELYTRKRPGYQRDSNQAFADSETMSNITAERFPLLERGSSEFKRQYDILRRRLYDGRNWHRIAQEFGSAIVYLVPSGGEFEISNSAHVIALLSISTKLTLTRVQRVLTHHFDNFLEVLGEKRGDFLQNCVQYLDRKLRDLSRLRQSSLLRLESTLPSEIKEKRFDSNELLSLLHPL